MGILSKWARRGPLAVVRRSLENPSTPLSAPDDWLFDALGAEKSDSGIRVGRKGALTYAAVWRAQSMISRDVGKIPLVTYRRTSGGKERATNHPAYRLLRRRPNPWMTAFVFKQTLQHHVLCYGNGYAYIVRDQRAAAGGKPLELIPLSPECTSPVIVEGQLWYTTRLPNGQQRKIPSDDMIHVKGLGFDGLQGYNVLQFARDSLAMGISARKYGASFYKNSARPSLILEHPQTMDDKAQARLAKSWRDMHSGIENQHKIAVLEQGMKANVLGISAKDAQFIETRSFEIRDVANWYGVPPHKLGDSSRTAYNSLEQENQSYLDDALDGWFVGWEEEATIKLTTEREQEEDTVFIEFLREALVRADIAARHSAFKIGIESGFYSPDEVRAKLNMNATEDGSGKGYRIPLNMKVAGEEDEPDDEEPPAVTTETVSDAETKSLPIVVNAVPLRDAFSQLMLAGFARMVTRVELAAGKAAKKPDEFIDWIESEFGKHGAAIRASLDPVVHAANLAGFGFEAGLVERIVNDAERALLEATDALPAELSERVQSGLKLWAETVRGLLEPKHDDDSTIPR